MVLEMTFAYDGFREPDKCIIVPPPRLMLKSDYGLEDEQSHREAMTTKSAHFDDLPLLPNDKQIQGHIG